MSFDTLAPHYRWMEWLLAGDKLQRCRTEFINAIAPPQEVLIYGEGNGRFLASLLRRHPDAHITSVDVSAVMIAKSKERLRRLGLDRSRVDFIHADALQWTPPRERFDLIVTHFFLDCFREDQLSDLIPAIATAAKSEATWLLGDFKMANAGLPRWRSRFVLAILYGFFRQMTHLCAEQLTAPNDFLTACGFKLTKRQEYDWGLLHSDLWIRRHE